MSRKSVATLLDEHIVLLGASCARERELRAALTETLAIIVGAGLEVPAWIPPLAVRT